MAFSVKILADSKAPCGKRLTTMEWTYPRPIHAEIMTHKMLSKNSASSRAIPTEKLIQRVVDDPWIPDYIGANQKGMAPGEELTADKREAAVAAWLRARDNAVVTAREMLALGVHKGVVNRQLEPYMWITVIISGTEWPNLFGLRLDKMAEPHFQHVARMARVAMDGSVPRELAAGEWHLPMIHDEDRRAAFTMVTGRPMVEEMSDEELVASWKDLDVVWVRAHVEEILKKVSVGRCARVSYLTHDGRRDLSEDIALHDRLVVQKPLHASPAEHQGQAMGWPAWWEITRDRLPAIEGNSIEEFQDAYRNWSFSSISRHEYVDELNALSRLLMDMQSGNFYGFTQYRKTLPNENITSWADVPAVSP